MTIAPRNLRGMLLLMALSLTLTGPADAQSQPGYTITSYAVTDSTNHTTPDHYWRNLAAGFVTSILAHEAGHVGMSLALGAHPSFGFEGAKPTVFSGIDATRDPHKQFLFSSAGLDVQAILNEAILDIPHNRGGAFERGILAGGIATAYFYATLGRNADNSDITFIARTSSLNKTSASILYAGIATIQLFRIAHDDHYANFFIRPSSSGGVKLGFIVRPDGL